MTSKRKKRHLLIGLLSAFALPCAGIATFEGLAAGPDVVAALAAEGTTITVPVADYEFTITYDGAVFSAACSGGLTVTPNALIADLVKDIDTAAGTGKVKKLIFDGGSDNALNIGNTACALTSGTYIVNGKLTGTNTTALLIASANVTLYVENAEIFSASVSTSVNGVILNRDNATVYILGGTVSSTSASGRAIYNYHGGTINILGGTISSPSSNAIYNASVGTINVSGGTVSSTSTRSIYNYGGGIINVTDGEISSNTGYAISNRNNGTVNVSGGKVWTVSSQAINNSSNSVVNVTGGEVYATGYGYGIYNDTGTTNVSGGTVYATDSTGRAINNYDGIININGTALVTSKNTGATGGTVQLNNAAGTLNYLEGSITNTAGGNVIYNPNGATVTIIVPLSELISLMNATETCRDYDQAAQLRRQYNALSEDEKIIFNNTVCAEDENCLMSEKLAYMESLAATGGPATQSNLQTNLINDIKTNLVSVLIIGLIGLSAIVGYAFILKRKYKVQ